MELIIVDVTVRQDVEGRFCLNDLHKAAGGESKHQPANWLRLQQTQDLAAELDKSSIPQKRGIESKQGLGTFACKELVYAYAMWISPQFSLKVIRAYDQLMTQGIVMRQDVAQQAADDPATFLAKAVLVAQHQLEQQKAQVIALEQKVAEQAPKAAAHDMLAMSDGDLCMTDAAKALSVPPRKFTSYLIHIGWAYRRQSNGRLVGHASCEKRGLISHRPVPIHHNSGEVETALQPLITPKGLAKLAEMLATGMRA